MERRKWFGILLLLVLIPHFILAVIVIAAETIVWVGVQWMKYVFEPIKRRVE